MKKRFLPVLGALVLLFAVLALPAQAAGYKNATRKVEITAELNNDGSAHMTEVWDVTIGDGTEYYLPHYNLDNQQITGLTVTDENGKVFTDVGTWDSSLNRQEKAGKSGIIRTKGGYELCWGFGEYGDHVFTVEYTITNFVKGYSDANAITHIFIPTRNLDIPEAVITIRKQGTTFTKNDTGIWIFQFSADYGIENGQLVARTFETLKGDWQAAVMVRFDKNMFAPLDVRNKSFETVKAAGMEGSGYKPGPEDNNSGYYNGNKLSNIINMLTRSVLPVLILMGFFGGFAKIKRGSSGNASGEDRKMKPEYKNPEYSRELPFAGSLPATYARLSDLNKLSSEGTVIGAYLLKWIRSGQVEIVSQMGGFFGNKEEDAIKLHDARPDMPPLERSLYGMLVDAAGSDWILQSKEFEKWSKKQYSKVEAWLEQYKNQGKQDMRIQGALATEDATAFFGLYKYKKSVLTPLGDVLTSKMFGFKKYLEDFTIINEREAREVQLWDEYLIFAQVFGIADKVAEQFKQLYPDYFTQMANQMGTQLDMFDMMMIMRITNSYSRALTTGYRAGYSAAHSTSFTGGGGRSFGGGGGGGGFSGGGGGGGSR